MGTREVRRDAARRGAQLKGKCWASTSALLCTVYVAPKSELRAGPREREREYADKHARIGADIIYVDRAIEQYT